MNTDTTRHVINPDGRVFRERVITKEIEIGDAVAKAFKVNNTTRINGVLEIPEYGEVNIIKDDQCFHWVIPVQSINLLCEWTPMPDGVLVPKFIYDIGSKSTMGLRWKRTADVMGYLPSIKMVVSIFRNNIGLYRVNKQYLFAHNNSNQSFRLPLSNVYETCELCNGEYDSQSGTQMAAVRKALDQFERSKWNADLYSKKDVELTEKFFRFKSEGAEFASLPINSNKWEDLCAKVSTPIIEMALA